MKKNDLVSIIIPCYNHGQHLEESVQSALEQTYQNIEIIIINDGSTDNTDKIAQGLQNKYPEKIKILTQKNFGLSAARNSGIRKASGAYIVPLDADDLLHRDMVGHCFNTITNSNTDIIHMDTQLFGHKKDKWIPIQFPKCNPLYRSCWVATSLYRRKVWEKTGGYKKNMVGGYEDMEFWVNAYKHGFKFKRCPEVLFYYRIKEKSMLTEAVTKDTYLKAKIVLNHPELYTIPYVQESINTIKETEQLADLYFYQDNCIPDKKEKLLTEVGYFLSNNALNKKQIIDIMGNKVLLCTLDLLKDNKTIQKLYKKIGIDFLLVYAPMRYEIQFLRSCKFAWKKDEGIIASKGSIFPFVPKSIRENSKTQLIAYDRLVKYQNIEKQELRNQVNSAWKLQKEIDSSKTKLSTLVNAIRQVILFPIIRHPIKKYRAYKLMLCTYSTIRKSK